MNLDRRDFLRVALAGGAAALIPKALLAAAPDAVGHTKIFITGGNPGDELVIHQVFPSAPGTSVEVFRGAINGADYSIDAPLKWGEIRVHLIQCTEGNFSIAGPEGRPMGVQILTSRTTEIEHDRMPDGEPTKRKNMISINGVETELDSNWDIVMPDESLVPACGLVQLQFTPTSKKE